MEVQVLCAIFIVWRSSLLSNDLRGRSSGTAPVPFGTGNVSGVAGHMRCGCWLSPLHRALPAEVAVRRTLDLEGDPCTQCPCTHYRPSAINRDKCACTHRQRWCERVLLLAPDLSFLRRHEEHARQDEPPRPRRGSKARSSASDRSSSNADNAAVRSSNSDAAATRGSASAGDGRTGNASSVALRGGGVVGAAVTASSALRSSPPRTAAVLGSAVGASSSSTRSLVIEIKSDDDDEGDDDEDDEEEDAAPPQRQAVRV